jgi:glycosyltransferase involved in cell wall biosynthesis
MFFGGSARVKILHIITGLEQGGAEAVLCRLVTAMRAEAEHVVVSLTGLGVYGPRLALQGITVHAMEFPRGRLTVRGLRRLWRLIKDINPDAIQTWLYHADLVGGLTGRLAGVRAVYWNIRNSTLCPSATSKSTRLTAHLCAWASGWIPTGIACCSERAALVHQELGYRANKLKVIPNGYDLRHFSRRPEARERLRREWNVVPGMPVIGMAARWDPQKDHANLLSALAILASSGSDFRCVLAGSGIEPANRSLMELISAEGLEDRLLLLGPRDDIPDVMSAVDLHVLSSAYGEAFPNAVAEAMACGVPCVVTDVGDSAVLVEGAGWVVPPRDPSALARFIAEALDVIRSPEGLALSQACRQRIVERFGLEKMVAAYRDVWSGGKKRAPAIS